MHIEYVDTKSCRTFSAPVAQQLQKGRMAEVILPFRITQNERIQLSSENPAAACSALAATSLLWMSAGAC